MHVLLHSAAFGERHLESIMIARKFNMLFVSRYNGCSSAKGHPRFPTALEMSQHNQMCWNMFLHNLCVCFEATKCIAGKLFVFLVHSEETDDRSCRRYPTENKGNLPQPIQLS